MQTCLGWLLGPLRAYLLVVEQMAVSDSSDFSTAVGSCSLDGVLRTTHVAWQLSLPACHCYKWLNQRRTYHEPPGSQARMEAPPKSTCAQAGPYVQVHLLRAKNLGVMALCTVTDAHPTRWSSAQFEQPYNLVKANISLILVDAHRIEYGKC